MLIRSTYHFSMPHVSREGTRLFDQLGPLNARLFLRLLP